jgi:hypothetical protein
VAGWTAFLDRTPYSQDAKAGILTVQTTESDFLANAPGAPLTQDQKRAYLTSITYKQYLQDHVGINDEAFYGQYWRGSGGLLGAGGQAVSAADCWILGRPGFPDAVGLGDPTDIDLPGIGRTPWQDSRSSSDPTRAWPDGNTSLLRLALSKLIPNAFPDVNVGRVGLNNWQAFADAKVNSVRPAGTTLFWDSLSLSAGAGFGPNATPGKYYGPTPNQPPACPAQLTFTVIPNHPDAIPQLFAYSTGQQMLLEMSWGDLEDSVIDLIDRTVNKQGGNFDPERDIHDWRINRWNYGYAHELTSTFDPSAYGPVENQPQYTGRQPYQNVAIACSDSEAFAYTHSAINEGYRAVEDLPAPAARTRRSRAGTGAAQRAWVSDLPTGTGRRGGPLLPRLHGAGSRHSGRRARPLPRPWRLLQCRLFLRGPDR